MSMDYTQAGLWFKIKKTVRYVRLYGFQRTLTKIRGQYHMKTTVDFDGLQWSNAKCHNPDNTFRQVGLIGCGNYAFSTIGYYLKKHNSAFLRGTYDIHKGRAMSLCENFSGLYVTADWRDIVLDPKIKTVFVASNHASHAEYAIACIEAGKHVHIEKPHVVSEEQLIRLVRAMQANPGSKVFLGFNRPKSLLFKKLMRVLRRETGPLMINWFIAGHKMPDGHWYFDPEEGGRVLSNLCHWTDLTLHLITMEKAFPCTIVPATPVGAKSDFVVSVIFPDQSCMAITFSAKGHTFEGVREVLNVHKENVLATLLDFQKLTIEVMDKKSKHWRVYRSHGHKENILNTIIKSESDDESGEDISYVYETAKFFLAIKQAIDSGNNVQLLREDISIDSN